MSMSTYETISVGLALVAIVISIITFFKSHSIEKGNIELNIREGIRDTKERVQNLKIPAEKLSDSDKLDLTKRLDAAIEENLNAYEEACAKYIDGKVDRKRFKKMYKDEIRNLVQNENLKKYFDGVTSTYKAILKVYREWEDLEK